MHQADIFDETPDLTKIDCVKVAGREQILKVFTAILLSPVPRFQDRLKAGENICKMQGYCNDQPKAAESAITYPSLNFDELLLIAKHRGLKIDDK